MGSSTAARNFIQGHCMGVLQVRPIIMHRGRAEARFRLRDGKGGYRYGTDHAGFLNRNRAELASFLSMTYQVPHRARPVLEELIAFVGFGAPLESLSQESRRTARSLSRTIGRRSQTEGAGTGYPKGWSTIPVDRRPRVSGLRSILQLRANEGRALPTIRSSLRTWKLFLASVGMTQADAETFASLVLDDRRALPSGERYTPMYRRIGFSLGSNGSPRDLRLVRAVHRQMAWGLAGLAMERCTPTMKPGKPCRGCPIRSFCQTGRRAAFQRTSRGPTFIDAFAGGGGLSLGFRQAGFRELMAIESDPHAADTLYLNHPEARSEGVLRADLQQLVGARGFVRPSTRAQVVIGGPPCQPYSLAHRHNRPDRSDSRRHLFRPFVQLAKQNCAEIVLMENVPGILTADEGRILREIRDEFSRAGYQLQWRKLDAADYGVPQHRRRVIFVALRTGSEGAGPADERIARFWALLDKRRRASPLRLSQALEGIPAIPPGGGSFLQRGLSRRPRGAYGRRLSRGTMFLANHQARPHNRRDIRIFKTLRPGETARQLRARGSTLVRYQTESFGDKYRKLRWNQASPTIPAHLSRDANSFAHPRTPRGLTCREAARIQSFPDGYVFLGGFGRSLVQVGNAVPPLFAESVAQAVRDALIPALRP
jgi:DNA (cytosine-5)-methyltransferase 1